MELNNINNDVQDKIKNLRFHQQQELVGLLNQFLANNSISPIKKAESDLCCPHCSSKQYVKNGMREDKQRYKCKKCSLSFTATSNTALHYVQKIEIWTDFVYLLLNSPVPPTLNELSQKLSISTKTAHEWKHKFLAAMNKLDNIRLRGEIEMDEIFLPFCIKGKLGKEKTKKIRKQERKVVADKQNAMFLCVHNREKDFDFFPIKIQQKGQVQANFLKPVIEALDIQPNTTIITDKSKGSTKYFKTRKDIKHEVFISSGKKTKLLHNNNINSTMSLYKSWSDRFNGYSTKYMWNYLKWFRFHRKFIEFKNLDKVVGQSVKDDKGFVRFVLIPRYYEEFLFTA